MCIFMGGIDYVTSTRIFSRIESNRQAIKYDMYLSTNVETAMVLPIPVAAGQGDTSVEFVNLSEYENIFDDLEGLFPKMRSPSIDTFSAGASLSLEVVQVGVFEASYVPTPNDFSRLDSRFRLNAAFFKKMPAYNDYGFVVFQLKPGQSQVHPMAFWFPTRDTSRLFFPTVHMHDGEVHDYDEFNHVLYAQGVIPKHPGLTLTNDVVGGQKIKTIMKKSKGLVSSESEVYKQELSGNLQNKDIWFPLN